MQSRHSIGVDRIVAGVRSEISHACKRRQRSVVGGDTPECNLIGLTAAHLRRNLDREHVIAERGINALQSVCQHRLHGGQRAIRGQGEGVVHRGSIEPRHRYAIHKEVGKGVGRVARSQDGQRVVGMGAILGVVDDGGFAMLAAIRVGTFCPSNLLRLVAYLTLERKCRQVGFFAIQLHLERIARFCRGFPIDLQAYQRAVVRETEVIDIEVGICFRIGIYSRSVYDDIQTRHTGNSIRIKRKYD